VGDAIPGAWYALLGKRWVATNQRFVAVPTPISFRHVLLFKTSAMTTTRSLIFLCLGPGWSY
jgi:hypothetical protein